MQLEVVDGVALQVTGRSSSLRAQVEACEEVGHGVASASREAWTALGQTEKPDEVGG